MLRCAGKPPMYFISPMLTLHLKLKAMKSMLKDWNKKVFGNIFNNISAAEDRVAVAQLTFDVDPCDANYSSLENERSVLTNLYVQGECFWRQKSHI